MTYTIQSPISIRQSNVAIENPPLSSMNFPAINLYWVRGFSIQPRLMTPESKHPIAPTIPPKHLGIINYNYYRYYNYSGNYYNWNPSKYSYYCY